VIALLSHVHACNVFFLNASKIIFPPKHENMLRTSAKVANLVLHLDENLTCLDENNDLTPKVLEAIFQAFLKFGQAIVDAMLVQKCQFFCEHGV
jgi:hypothetical protein